MRAVSDEQLIEWVANGDASCLGTLFERHHQGVFRYCRQIARDNTLAEDIVQEVFIKVLRKARSFRNEGSFKAWLFNITRNVSLDHLRKVKRLGYTEPFEESNDPSLVDHRSAEQAASGAEDISLLSRALARLPVAAQDVIWLGRFEFSSFEELAQALGCKTGTARVRMYRAMQQLNTEYTSINGAPFNE
jgi:RNA polymerase sigma-70 factor (ECF subfamily)